MPYLITWSPATEPSIALVLEALGLLTARTPELQLVVLGGAGCEMWQRWSRALGVASRCWLLAADAIPRADELIANATATIAPVVPDDCSAALWSHRARVNSPPHVALTAGDASWVTLVDGAPQVQVQARDAARTLALTINELLSLDAATVDHLATLRREALSKSSLEELTLVAPFLDAAWARHRQRNHSSAPSFRGDRESYLIGLSAATLRELGLAEVAPQTVHSIATSIADLAS